MGSGHPWAPVRLRPRTQGHRLALYAQPCPLRGRPLLGIHWGARRRWKLCERSFQARASFHSAGPSGFWCPLFFCNFFGLLSFDIYNGNTNHKDSWTFRTGSTQWLYFRGVSISFQKCALELEAALLERRRKVVPRKWSKVVPSRCAP